MSDERPNLVPVTPKMSGRGLPLPPRLLIVSMIVALVAFAVGLQVNPTRIVADYLLNCAAVPMNAPGQQVSFAMVLDVPPSVLPSRDAGIVWALDPYGRQGFPPRGPAEKLPIDVVAP